MFPSQSSVLSHLRRRELAGLSVAEALAELYTPPSRVLVICGPGNNGGDGLVCARHLFHFGYAVSVCSPKTSANQAGLRTQLRQLGVPFVAVDDVPKTEADVLVDAMFGFSFVGPPRAPFDGLLALLAEQKRTPIVSVDVPSGWSVDACDVKGAALLQPDVLVSLTAPKVGVRNYKGIHFLGGRFVPPSIAERFGLVLPYRSGSSQQCMRIL